MPQFLSPAEAVKVIKDGDCIIYSNFLGLTNPEQLSVALNERFKASGSPKELTLYCTAGLGGWTSGSPCEEIVCLGAVNTVIFSHFSTTPDTARMILENELEGYNLPFGAMSHAVRGAASGQEYIISDAGLNLFVDPKYKGYQLNSRSKQELVEEIIIDGKRRLKYKTPKPDVAFIKATSADKYGNISMEKEAICGDALSIAQAVSRRGGKVIVQVERVLDEPRRPWEVVIPAALVDIVCICPEQTQIYGIQEENPAYCGDKFMTDDELCAFVREGESGNGEKDIAKLLIARRAVQELQPGHVVNIGVGAPEFVAVEAAKNGILPKVALTVEAGSMKGLPAGGTAFGAALSPHSICTTAQQFDFYDGGGLDICFIGALEIDGAGNVNGHYSAKKLSGIGGFINITQFTPKVVFCTTFTAGGLKVAETENGVEITNEGRFPKFVEQVQALSFSAQNAHDNKQEIIYVTERCVFRLTPDGLELSEVARGIDLEKDILQKLPFEVKVAENLKIY